MKIKFDSYRDIVSLQNSLLFAEHSLEKIARIKELDPARGEQCERENEAWVKAQNILHKAKPDEEVELYLA
jgi:hypothetical protein